MLFNSFEFALFFPAVFLVYWLFLGKSIKAQNVFLLAASYFFYSMWDWRFVFLLAFSTFLDYFSGLKVHNAQSNITKKIWLVASVGINLGFLGVFKYYNFFAESFAEFLLLLGCEIHPKLIEVILPVGISFYTFHGLSYVFDIYNKKIVPTTNVVNYMLFVCFFPLLVAGPIERATHLLPQVERKRFFNYSSAVNGLKQVLWGLFKKVVIADNCAEYANMIFNDSASYSGATLLAGALFFTIQIYGDFSGYSDIALGTARMLGFELLQNFRFPYFSRDIAEFWRRWHISLSSWFRDYLYIPLGGSKGGKWMSIRNTFIIFLVSGFWHGANWTFIAWGGLNALYILPLLILGKNRNNVDTVAEGRWFPNFKELMQMLLTFMLTVVAWIFFRAESITHAFKFLQSMLLNLFQANSASALKGFMLNKVGVYLPLLVVFFFVVEWMGRTNKFAIETLPLKQKSLRIGFYYIIALFIFLFAGREQEFIYFQF
jgi:D-alanyl-lipoteichoic acid acyltransferase DltB (MBOAT superfamily)